MHGQCEDPSISSYGGRLAPTVNWPTVQTTAPPFPVSLIPVALGTVLVLVSAWSWTVLRAGLGERLQREVNSPPGKQSTITNPNVNLVDEAHDGAILKLSKAFTPEVLYWSADILTWAAEYELNPNLVATVIQIESCGHP
ncbi:MAG: hypothetical protein GTO14_20255, partial [Anaerolineales bacterium]|nr:hypothetical protein [Anaerolineales bacterium]